MLNWFQESPSPKLLLLVFQKEDRSSSTVTVGQKINYFLKLEFCIELAIAYSSEQSVLRVE